MPALTDPVPAPGRRVRRLIAGAAALFSAAALALPVPEVPDFVVGPSAAPVRLQPPGQGRLLAAAPVGEFAAAEVTRLLATGATRVPALTAKYGVRAWRLEYLTIDADGRSVRASGLVAVPAKAPGARSPLLSYQHATIFRDAEAPSNDLRADAPPIVLASLGYIVIAADYVGYGVSRGSGHPYLLSAPSAAAVIDLLTAARSWRAQHSVFGNGQLFLAGYSEGGYVTMAAQRAIETEPLRLRDELVASVPGAGPYHLGATLDALLERVKRERGALVAALIDPGFLHHLPGWLRVELRRALVRALLPGDADVSFDTRFVDAFIEDDNERIERQSNVHDWAPSRPVRFFHGRDDHTVPYAASSATLEAMRARGAADIRLTDCPAVPADHLDCVTDYWTYLIGELAARAADL